MDADINLSEFVRDVYNYSAAFSIAFNALLIYLILSEKSIKAIGYKSLMVITAVFEIVYSLLDVFLVPIHYSYASAIVELVDVSDKYFGRPVVNVIHFIYNAFFGAFLALLSLHFIYRWFVVTDHPLLSSFNSAKISFWLLIPFLTGLVYALLGVYVCGPNKETSDFLREGIMKAFGRDIDDFGYLAMHLFEEKANGEVELHLASIFGIAMTFITIIPSFFTIIFFGVKCYRRIRSLLRMTSSTKNDSLQSQLFYALVFQTLIPFVLMHIPVTILLILAFTGTNLGKYGMIVSTSITLYPAIDPLPTFFIVKPLRRRIMDFVTCRNIEIVFVPGRSTERVSIRT